MLQTRHLRGPAHRIRTFDHDQLALQLVAIDAYVPHYTLTSDVDDFHSIVIHSGYNQTRYLNQLQFLPGDPSSVHHVFIYRILPIFHGRQIKILLSRDLNHRIWEGSVRTPFFLPDIFRELIPLGFLLTGVFRFLPGQIIVSHFITAQIIMAIQTVLKCI